MSSKRQRELLKAGKPLACTGIRSHLEVAQIMTRRGYPMSRGLVYQIERMAINKLRAALADLACDFDPEFFNQPRRKKTDATDAR